MNRYYIRHTLLAFAFWLSTSQANAAPTHDRIVVEGSASADSDGLHERTADAGYVHPLSSLGPNAMFALRAGYFLLDSATDRIEFSTLQLNHQRSVGPVDVTLEAKQLVSGEWSPTVGNADFNFHVTPVFSIELGGDSNLVDTVIAARLHTRVNTANISANYQVLDSVTVIGEVLGQWFSDGNHRVGGVGRAIYSPAWLEGFNVQLRVRRIDSEFAGVGYFSPDRLEEALVLLQYGRAVLGDKIVLTAVVGGGAQRIDGMTTSSLYQAEFRGRGWFTDAFGFEAKAGCKNTGGLEVQAATGGYRYCYGNLSLIKSF